MTFDILAHLKACGIAALFGGLPVLLLIALIMWPVPRRHLRRKVQTDVRGAHPYRAPFSPAGQEPTTDPGEAWQAGVEAERARVLTIVRAVREASKDSDVHRAADAIRDGVKAGPL